MERVGIEGDEQYGENNQDIQPGFQGPENKFNRIVAVQNKSSILLKIIFTNTQKLKLFTININHNLFTKDIKNSKKQSCVLKDLESYN
jgi:hypothetical protein